MYTVYLFDPIAHSQYVVSCMYVCNVWYVCMYEFDSH